MTAPTELRLLPWEGPEGKPCYLSTDDRGGYVSRLADDVEADQLGSATELLQRALDTLDDQDTAPEAMLQLAKELTVTLADVLRIATSGGHLLAGSERSPFG